MKAWKGYAGFEPSFIVGVLVAASSSLAISLLYSAASAVQAITVALAFSLCFTDAHSLRKASQVIMPAAALAAGIFCGLNGRIICYSTGSLHHLAEHFQPAGQALQAAIDAIPFRHSETSSLVKALLTGNRSDLPRKLTEAFRNAGAAHILALSGLHLGIIYAITDRISAIFGNTPKARIPRSAFNVVLCTVYTLATGASASITRALLFIILREAGKALGRPVTLKDLLRKCLLIHLIINPQAILDIGFQLSYAAIAGIAWIYPRLKGIWKEDSAWPIMKRIWDSAALTISCQLTTAPLAWHHFRTFPIYFLLTNLLALPLTGILIPISILTAAMNAAGLCPEILTKACEKTASCLIFIIETISLM